MIQNSQGYCGWGDVERDLKRVVGGSSRSSPGTIASSGKNSNKWHLDTLYSTRSLSMRTEK